MATKPNIRQIEDGIVAPSDSGLTGQVLTADGSGGTNWTNAEEIGGVVAFSGGWNLSTVDVIADPGAGIIRTDNTLSTTTALAVSVETDSTANAKGILDTLTEGSLIVLQEDANTDNWVSYKVNAPVTDNTTWYEIPVIFESQGGTLAKGVDVFVRYAYAGGGGGQVDSVVGGDNITVDSTDPANPIVNLDSSQTHTTFALDTTDATGLANTITAGSNGVIEWDWDGTNTSVALQHNGSDALTVDETGTEVDLTAGQQFEVGFAGETLILVTDIGGFAVDIGRDTDRIVHVGQNATGTVQIGNHQDSSNGTVSIGARAVTGAGTTSLTLGHSATAGAQVNINIGSGVTNDIAIGFFGATPVAQPVLTTGTMEELRTALGSTSGLGLVNDSGVATPTLTLVAITFLLKTSNQSIGNNSTTPVIWENAVEDPLGAWVSGSDVTVPANITKMRVSANVQWTSDPNGRRFLSCGTGPGGSNTTDLPVNNLMRQNSISSIINVTPGAVITPVQVFQDSGAALDLQNISNTWVCIEWYA